MKRHLAIILGSVLPILACDGQNSPEAQGLCSTESKAILAASDVLSRQRSASEYEAGKAYALSSGNQWDVWIPVVAPPGKIVQPSHALIEVKKANCSSRWVPQY